MHDDTRLVHGGAPGIFPEGVQLSADRIIWVGGLPSTALMDRHVLTLFDGEHPVWQAAVLVSHGAGPFARVMLWRHAGVALFGVSDRVFALSAETGQPIRALSVPSYFSDFVLVPDETAVFVLGASLVVKLAPPCEVLWRSPEIAVDGVVFAAFDEDRLVLDCELDPPGGWVRVALNSRTGTPVPMR